MNIFGRIWTGIVAAVAGAALALVIQVVGQMTVKLSPDALQPILWTCVGIGFLLGLIVGPRTKPTKRDSSKNV